MSKTAFIKTPIAPLYRAPEREISLEDEVLCGMQVSADEDENGFYKVTTHYGYEGYIEKKYLLLCSRRVKRFSSMRSQYRMVGKNACDILTQAKYQGNIIITLPAGSIVAVTEELDDGWCKVYLCDGTEGYTKISHLDAYLDSYDVNDDELRDRLVAVAEKYLGVQYRWGGKTPFGIDCSGLCSMAYMRCGIIIFRDSRLNDAYPVKEIPYESLKKGDLIYSKGHIMMYIGDGRIIHSTSSMCGVTYGQVPEKEKILACGSIFPQG